MLVFGQFCANNNKNECTIGNFKFTLSLVSELVQQSNLFIFYQHFLDLKSGLRVYRNTQNLNGGIKFLIPKSKSEVKFQCRNRNQNWSSDFNIRIKFLENRNFDEINMKFRVNLNSISPKVKDWNSNRNQT
jgi:hypothetical protein